MCLVGLTGGYASGKTLIAQMMGSLGAKLIYADQLGHDVLRSGQPAYEPVARRFGEGVLDPVTKEIDRKKLGQLVFADRELLSELESIIHPAVYELEDRMERAYRVEDPASVVVIEAAILIETGRYTRYDKIVLAACAEHLQIERGMKRDRITAAEAKVRIDKQMSLSEKRRIADYVIDTDGSKEATRMQVERVYRELRRL